MSSSHSQDGYTSSCLDGANSVVAVERMGTWRMKLRLGHMFRPTKIQCNGEGARLEWSEEISIRLGRKANIIKRSGSSIRHNTHDVSCAHQGSASLSQRLHSTFGTNTGRWNIFQSLPTIHRHLPHLYLHFVLPFPFAVQLTFDTLALLYLGLWIIVVA